MSVRLQPVLFLHKGSERSLAALGGRLRRNMRAQNGWISYHMYDSNATVLLHHDETEIGSKAKWNIKRLLVDRNVLIREAESLESREVDAEASVTEWPSSYGFVIVL